jgi:hypothetical protein
MGTGQNSTDTQKRVTKPPRCSLCKQVYTPMCDFLQGRCPHHPATIDIGLAGKAVPTRFQNIINLFKRKPK